MKEISKFINTLSPIVTSQKNDLDLETFQRMELITKVCKGILP